MKKRFLASLAGAASLLFSTGIEAGSLTKNNDIHGKVELGPAYMHIDFLRNGVTNNRLDLYGLQGNASVVLWKGFTVKMGGLYGRNDGLVSSFSLAAGWTIPVEIRGKKIYLTPNAGHTWGYLRSNSDIAELSPLDTRVKQAFHNSTPFIGTDVTVSAGDFTVTGMIQYGWTRSKVTFQGPGYATAVFLNAIPDISGARSESRGFNSGLVCDYWLNDHWSINAAVGLQKSQSKEKEAMRAYGGRVGVGYFF